MMMVALPYTSTPPTLAQTMSWVSHSILVFEADAEIAPKVATKIAASIVTLKILMLKGFRA
jgi:hypothetical protein